MKKREVNEFGKITYQRTNDGEIFYEYYPNGQVETKSFYRNDKLCRSIKYDFMGRVIQYKELLPASTTDLEYKYRLLKCGIRLCIAYGIFRGKHVMCKTVVDENGMMIPKGGF